jgi:hypothetical protein
MARDRSERDHLSDEDEEPLVDRTEALTLHSRRTARRQRKTERKLEVEQQVKNTRQSNFLSLPYEIVLQVLCESRPSDVFRLSRVCKALHELISQDEKVIAKRIIGTRYSSIEKCFRLPVLLQNVDIRYHSVLLSVQRQEIMTIHKRQYQHLKSPDPQYLCTCLTCMLRWNALCLAVDFAHWQGNLDGGDPIPMIPRGKNPEWNQQLVQVNADVVLKAIRRPLWYASILEAHLISTIRSIRRHSANKGNKRSRFKMDGTDCASGTDHFLNRAGPANLDFPFHRDNYYMLEAYLPNRGWHRETESWTYLPAEQHETDLEITLRWASRSKMEIPIETKPVEIRSQN